MQHPTSKTTINIVKLQDSGKKNRKPEGVYNPWEVDFATGGTFPFQSGDKDLFRGNGITSKLSAKHFWGNVGLGASSGFMTGKISEPSLNQFLKQRGFSREQTNIGTADPVNAFLLVGPSFRFGSKVSFNVDVQGGLFLNNPGMVDIAMKGEARSFFRFTGGTGNYAPGFSGAMSVRYPLNNSTFFMLHSEYLQTKTNVSWLDLKSGIDIPTQLKRNVSVVTAGVGIVKLFGASNAQSRKHPAGVKYEDFYTPAGAQGNCGPVTVMNKRADGSVEQVTFACPDDAATYSQRLGSIQSMPSRLSMTPTTTRQTQGKDFGEKVAGGLQSGGGVISGYISWQPSKGSGIITNEMVAASTDKTRKGGGGAVSSSYAAGMVINNDSTSPKKLITSLFYIRESGSGRKTSSGKYQLVYDEKMRTACAGCNIDITNISETAVNINNAEIKSPLYTGNGTVTNNPMYERAPAPGNPLLQSNHSVSDNALYQGKTKKDNGHLCRTTDHFLVVLTDPLTGEEIANTKTDSCGNFWFSNVPEGTYGVKITGYISVEKKYELEITGEGSYDLGGEMRSGFGQLSLALNSQESDSTVLSQKVVVRGWDPKVKKAIVGSAGNSGSSQRVAGNPIGGIIVKGGKNPGGQMKTVTTDGNGRFEFTGLTKGNYIISATIPYMYEEKVFVNVGSGGEP